MAELEAGPIRLHVQRLGKPPPAVLFLHGLVMDNLSSFYFTLANPVAERAEAVLFDLRGHGKSTRPEKGYALSDFVADAKAVADTIDRPLHLVGNSFGGLLALAFAAERPAQVASVVLLDGHLGLPGWGDKMAATLSLTGPQRDQQIAESFKHWLGRNSTRKRYKLAETARALVEGTSLVADIRASRPVSLSGLKCPVLALYGEQSDLRPEADALREAVPSSRIVVRPGSTHSILWEATGWVKEQLLGWLEEHRT